MRINVPEILVRSPRQDGKRQQCSRVRLVRSFQIIGVGRGDFQERLVMQETGTKLYRRYQREIHRRVRAHVPIEAVDTKSQIKPHASGSDIPVGNQRIFMCDLQYLVELHGKYGVDDEQAEPDRNYQ